MLIYFGVQRSLKSVLALTCLLFTASVSFGQIQIQKKEFQAPDLKNSLLEMLNPEMDQADYDGDGDLDLIMCGYHLDVDTCIIYENQGNGNLVPMQNSNVHKYGDYGFAPYTPCIFTSGDLDGDNDIDLIFTRNPVSDQNEIYIYLNNGSGVFTPQSVPSSSCYSFDVELEDIDEDNDLDIIFIKNLGSTEELTVLLNDGNANFSSQSIIPISWKSKFSFGDIDGDNDLDLLIGDAEFPSTDLLFTNDGSGNFTAAGNGPLIEPTAYHAEALFIDLNGDSNLDVALGNNFYLNNGSGGFSLINGNSMNNCYRLDFADIDGDNDLDLLASHAVDMMPINPTIELYLNDGNGVFTVDLSNDIHTSRYNLMFYDYNSDGQQDIITSGVFVAGQDVNTADLYINDSGSFTEVFQDPIKEIQLEVAFMLDLNNDNYLDLFVNGAEPYNFNRMKQVYLNDGQGNFDLHDAGNFDAITWIMNMGDLNGDTYPDIIYSDYASSPNMKIMVNDGNGNFTDLPASSFQALNGNVVLGDLDGDNDLDLISTDPWNATDIKVFLNDGNAVFTELTNTGLALAIAKEIRIADFDGDNDNDILMFGSTNSKIYLNDGNANFTENTGQPFKRLGSYTGLLEIGDLDGDGDLDIYATGGDLDNGNQMESEFYINDGAANFTLSTTAGPIFTEGDAQFVDLDNDNDQDLIVTGINDMTNSVSHIYENDGNGNFTLDQNASDILFQCDSSKVIAGDIDNDNDMDIVIGGMHELMIYGVKVYENMTFLMTPEVVQETSDLKIYPNPNQGQFTVSSDQLIGEDIQVFDAIGRMVYNRKHVNASSFINLNQLGQGNYIVCLGNNSYKLIVQ